MSINKKAVRIIIIFIISALIILLKEGNVYGRVKDFSYKLGDGEVGYMRSGNTIHYGATNVCTNVTRAETLGLDGRSNPNFYCASEGASAMDGENHFQVGGFIEIGPEGFVVTQYRGGSDTTTLTPWFTDNELNDEQKNYLLTLYYIFTMGNYDYGFQDYDDNNPEAITRQFSLWQIINDLKKHFDFDLVQKDENGSNPDMISRNFLNSAKLKAKMTNPTDLEHTIRIWYFTVANFSIQTSFFKQSNMMVLIDDYIEKEENKGSLTITKVDSKDNSKKLSGAEFVISTNQKNITSINGRTKWTTDNQGKTTISDLKAGTTYYIYESKAPKGYNLSDQGGVKEGLGVYIGSLYVSPEGGNVPWTVTNKTGGRRQWK